MRRLLIAALAVVPAFATVAAESPAVACDVDGEIVTEEGLETAMAAPLPEETTDQSFYLDLSASGAESATVTVTISDVVPTNDYDISVNGVSSASLFTPDTVELEVDHCEEMYTQVINFLAVPVQDVSVTFVVSG